VEQLEQYAAKRKLTITKVYSTPGGDHPYRPSGPHLRARAIDENGKRVSLWFDPSPRPSGTKQRGWRKA